MVGDKMIKKITMDGNEACSLSAYAFSDICGIYPITPSSPMAEHIDKYGKKMVNIFGDKVKVVEMQSEAGAAGFIEGALQTGVLATTFTASQGLLLMIPSMYKMAGALLPGVIHVAARSLSTHALSIFGDHQDIYATRQTGFAILASSNVQDAHLLGAVAHLSALKSSVPFLHFFDGFRTSHEVNKINVLEIDDYKNLLDQEALDKFRKRAMNPLKPNVRGTAMNDDVYFQITEARNKDYDLVSDIVSDYMSKINELAGTDYKPFNYYGSKSATKVIVAMGSVCNTIKEVIDDLNGDIGLIEVHLYRPFSVEYLLKVLPDSVKKIAVLDRTKEAGSIGEPLYLDIVAALKDKDIEIVGGRYGLSSKDTRPNQIKAIYDMLDGQCHEFTIGIDDDVTNLSLTLSDYEIHNSREMLIWGYGSDGMVSASKSIIKLIGNNTSQYVQAYFEYDSRKSGGVTVSHMRFSDKEIKSSYYVKNPSILVVSKETYLKDYDLVSNLEDGAIVIINTTKSKEALVELMNEKNKKMFSEHHAKIYLINAYDIALKNGLDNKISMIMEYAIMYITKMIDRESFKQLLIADIKRKFISKGQEVVDKNIDALNFVENSIEGFVLDGDFSVNLEKENNLYTQMMRRKGNDLKVSDLLVIKDGIVEPNTADLERKGLAESIPNWIMENCIQCNMCSFNCPHGVIRAFLLNEEEYNKCSDKIKARCMKAIGSDYYYTLGISAKNCTGCGLCIKNCLGKKGVKALEFANKDKQEEQEIFDYLDSTITEKDVNGINLKNCGFIKPKFRYCGACAGCGEAGYIRLLTQLFKDNLVIANATGCSSIYGSSMPSIPYNVAWASSLFENNAEFGFGMVESTRLIRERIGKIMNDNMDNENSELFKKYLDNMDNYEITKEVYDNLTDNIPAELKSIKDYIPKRNIWCIGGDGWAYDIGFGGLDHVLSSNENINVLVLDTETYSNTGGQASKSTPIGTVAEFAANGKQINKKDLAKIAMTYPNCYVASVAMGANGMQTIKAFQEAVEHDGPSLIIAYSPCIAHGINGGLINSVDSSKLAVNCGYHLLFRYHPVNGLKLDYKNVNFDLYEDYLKSQNRYKLLKAVNEKSADELFKQNKANAVARYNDYFKMEN